MTEKVSGSVALNWSPTAYLSMAPAFLPSTLSLPLSLSPQPARARAAAPPAAARSWRRVICCMRTPSWGRGEVPASTLDRAEHDAGDEVPLDERIDEQDRQHGQDD